MNSVTHLEGVLLEDVWLESIASLGSLVCCEFLSIVAVAKVKYIVTNQTFAIGWVQWIFRAERSKGRGRE